MGVSTPHFVALARQVNYFGGTVWGHLNKIGNYVGGWPLGLTICLCGQQSSVHMCCSLPFLPVDGVVPIAIKSNCHLWVFFMSFYYMYQRG